MRKINENLDLSEISIYSWILLLISFVFISLGIITKADKFWIISFIFLGFYTISYRIDMLFKEIERNNNGKFHS